MQKALVQMNVQLPLVVSDITGVTGLRILRDIVAGQRDPQHLAQHRDYRCHASAAEIVAALTGNYRPEHVFVLQQNLELFDSYQCHLATSDAAIEAHLQRLTARGVAAHDRTTPSRDAAKNPVTMNRASRSAPHSTNSPASTCHRSTALAPTTPFVCSRKSAQT